MNAMDSESADGDPSYAYKSSLMGAPFEFRLAADALEWRKGTYAGRTPYDRIRRIRLSFRPMTMQNYRFLTEVWVADGPKLQIASTSWKSIFEHERFDAIRDLLLKGGMVVELETDLPGRELIHIPLTLGVATGWVKSSCD